MSSHLCGVSICIVDTGIVTLIQPLDKTKRNQDKCLRERERAQ